MSYTDFGGRRVYAHESAAGGLTRTLAAPVQTARAAMNYAAYSRSESDSTSTLVSDTDPVAGVRGNNPAAAPTRAEVQPVAVGREHTVPAVRHQTALRTTAAAVGAHAPRAALPPAPTIVHNQVGAYMLERLVCTSAHATIWYALYSKPDGSMHPAIIKRVPLHNAEGCRQLNTEAAALQRLSHPHIVRMRHMMRCPAYLYMVLDYFSGGDLEAKRLRDGMPLGEPACQSIVRQLLHGLRAAHAAGIAHRDIKASNILLQREVVALADFGLAKMPPDGAPDAGAAAQSPCASDGNAPYRLVHNDKSKRRRLSRRCTDAQADAQPDALEAASAPGAPDTDTEDRKDASGGPPCPRDWAASASTPCGTCQYVAPEVLACIRPPLSATDRLPASDAKTDSSCVAAAVPRRRSYNPFQADMWAVGVLTYVLYTGVYPYAGATTTTIQDEIARHSMRPLPRGASTALRRFVAALLTPDPAERPSADAALRHAWLAQTAVCAQACCSVHHPPLSCPACARASVSLPASIAVGAVRKTATPKRKRQ